MKHLDDVCNFIKLFNLSGKLADINHWNETIVNAFTKGYCYNFAKALEIAFHEKYNCTIVGVGTISIMDYQMYNLTEIKQMISDLVFSHYVCQIEHKQDTSSVYNCDILGMWPLDEPSDYKVIHIKTPEDKQKLLDVIDHPDKLLEAYPTCGCYGWRFMWYFTSSEQEKFEDLLKKIDIKEVKTKIDCSNIKTGTILKVSHSGGNNECMYLIVSKIRHRKNKIYVHSSETIVFHNGIPDIMTFDDPYEFTEERFKSDVTILKGKELAKLKQDLKKENDK